MNNNRNTEIVAMHRTMYGHQTVQNISKLFKISAASSIVSLMILFLVPSNMGYIDRTKCLTEKDKVLEKHIYFTNFTSVDKS